MLTDMLISVRETCRSPQFERESMDRGQQRSRSWRWIFLQIIVLASLIPNPADATLIYDFESAEASVLDGTTVGTFVVDSVPLDVEAGTLQSGNFTAGGAQAHLTVVAPGSITSFPSASGLGVSSTFDQGTALSRGLEWNEGLRFNFDSTFVPDYLTYRVFGHVSAFHIYSNLPGGAVTASGGSGADGWFTLRPGISSMSITLADADSDAAVFVTSISSGTLPGVPEPSTLLLFAMGIIVLAIIHRQYDQRRAHIEARAE